MKKSLAATLRRWAQRLDPQADRPLYGDVHINMTPISAEDWEPWAEMMRRAGDAR